MCLLHNYCSSKRFVNVHFSVTFTMECKCKVKVVFTVFTFEVNVKQTWDLILSKYDQSCAKNGIYFIFATFLLPVSIHFSCSVINYAFRNESVHLFTTVGNLSSDMAIMLSLQTRIFKRAWLTIDILSIEKLSLHYTI